MRNDASALWLRISAHGTKGLKQDWHPYIDGLGKTHKGLFVPRGLATSIPCGSNDCMEGCYAEVQDVGGKFRAVCPNGYRKPFEVTRESILLYEIHAKTLHKHLARALSLNDDFSEFPDNSRLIRIGKSTQATEAPRPNYVAYCYESRHLKACLSDIQADANGNSFVLLLANPKAHTPGLDGPVAKLGGELKFLRDLVDITASGIVAKETNSVKEPAIEYRPSAKFPTPESCSWGNIRIEFANDDEVLVSAPKVKATRYSYAEMGMKNNKKTGIIQFNSQWVLLESFAKLEGRIRFQGIKGEDRMKKQKQLLSEHLKKFFGLDEEPIRSERGEYVCSFMIVPNRKTERKTSYSSLGMESDSYLREMVEDESEDGWR